MIPIKILNCSLFSLLLRNNDTLIQHLMKSIFNYQLTKKIRAPEYSPFETIQHLFETFFNILNKLDICVKY